MVTANILSPEFDLITLMATCIGVTSLLLAAKGNAWAMILMIIFSIMYGIISWRFHYYGEMITYLGMSMPMSGWALITWILHPSESGSEVEINHLTKKHVAWLIVSTGLVTVAFYYVLKYFDTPNLFFSTISITTSFLAAALTMLRSSYFAFVYAMNDLILIVLWLLASFKNPVYVPVMVNFVIFFINDLYGFVSWKRRE